MTRRLNEQIVDRMVAQCAYLLERDINPYWYVEGGIATAWHRYSSNLHPIAERFADFFLPRQNAYGCIVAGSHLNCSDKRVGQSNRNHPMLIRVVQLLNGPCQFFLGSITEVERLR